MAASAPLLAEAADSLALAVIDSSDAPVLLLDDALGVIAASRSFGDTFGIDSANVAGQTLPELGEGEWAVPQLGSLLKSVGLDETYNARVTVRAVSGTGKVAAYASVIDLVTNDPTYVPAQ